MTRRKGLGRGLRALLPVPFDEETENKVIPLELLKRSAHQPRLYFLEKNLDELAQSIKEKGILEPLLVRPVSLKTPGNNTYEIIAGERRWKAAKLAGLNTVPVRILQVSPEEAAEIALIENLQREDLSPIEEARALEKLGNTKHCTHADLARVLGKSRSYITNMFRILTLEKEIQALLSQGKIGYTHVRPLIGKSRQVQLRFLKEFERKPPTVREVEKKVGSKQKRASEFVSRDVRNSFESFFDAKVRIHLTKRGGELQVRFYSVDHFNNIYEKIRKK